jgi:hypothetical protein
MKKLLSISLLLFQLSVSKAQSWIYHPFPSGSDSAIWIQQHSNSEGSTYFLRTYLYGDTTISSYNYKKLYRTSVNAFISPSPSPSPFYHPYNFIGALREDVPAKKVYYYEAFTGVETLLYDFTLTVGDTAYIDGPFGGDTVEYTVTGIDSILVDSVYHKRLIIEPFAPIGPSPMSGNWIEGIGCEAGPLNRYVMGFEFSHALACFGVNNVNKYFYAMWPPSPDCTFSVGIGELENNIISLVVSPNPSAGIVTLSVSCNETLSVEIMDVSGNVIWTSLTAGFSGSTLDLRDHANGIYFVRLGDSKGNSVTKKIVKQ